MTFNSIQSKLDGYFKFKKYSAYQNAPTEFENTLDQFATFQVYENFEQFIKDNEDMIDIWNETLDDDDRVTPEDIFSDREVFEDFISFWELNRTYYTPAFGDNIPFLYAEISSKGGDSVIILEQLENIENDSDLIAFINDVLNEGEHVTHSSGVRSMYECVGFAD